jgi:hypothetical protein
VSKFNIKTAAPRALSPITTERTPSLTTFEGGPGYQRDVKSELFLLAVSNMVGERTFYETSGDRDDRYVHLVREATLADPEWTAGLLKWLRSEGNLRSASLVGAAEFAKARLDADLPGMSRQVIDSVLQRADEPGEMLAYWTATYGRAVPKPVKRGVADAVRRLYGERSLLKYDTASKGFRFGDVLDLVHPTPSAPWQGELFTHALDRRHNRDNPIPGGLRMLAANAVLRVRAATDRTSLLHPDQLRDAGMTWEDALSLAGTSVDKAELWTALIPSMGYMALLRNLRNFDEAGVADTVAKTVADRLADPGQVATSRQLPLRFLSAYRAAPSLRWSWALEQAITHSLGNVPSLPGRTLILVDTSSSMQDVFSKDGSLMRWDAAAVFGIALGSRCADGDVVSFSSAQYYSNDPRGPKTKQFPVKAGESLLKAVERWKDAGYFLGGGTDTPGALAKHYDRHDRVVILTDEQAGYGDVGGQLPANIPLYTWNLAGYRAGHAPSGSSNRHTFGGLTDQSFRMIPLLEAGRSANWPF